MAHTRVARRIVLAVLATLAAILIVAPAAGAFDNTTPITIPGSGTGPAAASSYPSNIDVSGLDGRPITNVTVTLHGLSHTFPDDIDVLLVGPNGENVLLMSDAGGSLDLNNVDLTFDDAAASSLPDATQITAGTYKPTNFTGNDGPSDSFTAPAPGAPYGTALSVFNGENPNGTWSLYIFDDANGDSGSLAGGWTLNLQTADAATMAQVTGSFSSSSPTQTGRVLRVNPNSSCGAPKPYPGTTEATQQKAYQKFDFINELSSPACIGVIEDPMTCTGPSNQVFNVLYTGAFDPANIQTNYAGAPSVSGASSYLVNVPTGRFSVVASAVDAGEVCPGFGLTITSSPPQPPPATAVANDATNVTTTSGQLNGTANPSTTPLSGHFEWGTTSSYGNTTPTQNLGSGGSNVPVLAGLTGLAPNTTFHYRLVVTRTNTGTTVASGDHTFKTANPVAPAPPLDKTPPSFLSARLTNSTFAVNPKGPSETLVAARKKAKKGTKFVFSLSEASRVVFKVSLKQPGRKVGRSCKKPSSKNKKKHKCTRLVSKGAFAVNGVAGSNSHAFSGIIGGRKLKPGSYQVTLTATDAAGNKSALKKLSFKIVKG